MPITSEPASKPAAEGASAPPSAGVAGNLWTAIDVAEIGSLEAAAKVSVIVSGPDPDGRLPLTIAALAHATYPSALTEVVVVGRPSVDEAALREAAGGLELSVVEGTRFADGAAAAGGEILLLLAAGAMPERTLVEAHARWHHAVADAVSSGLSRAVDATGIRPADVARAQSGGGLEPLLATRVRQGPDRQGALEVYLESTRDLTERSDDVFRVAAQAGVAMRAETYEAAGGGGPVEDEPLARLDLAYRLASVGCVFVPERAALSFDHYSDRGLGLEGISEWMTEEDPAGGPVPADPRMAALVPAAPFRPRESARVHARPAMVVNVLVGEEGAADILETVDAVLRGRFQDLELRLVVADGHPERPLLEEACSADPRITLGPRSTEGPSESALQVTLPVVAVPDERTFEDIHELMTVERMGALHVTVPGELPRLAMVEAVATGPLARARRVAAAEGEKPEVVLGRLFGERWVSGVEVSIRRRGAPEPQVTEHGPLAPATDLDHERTQHLRHSSRSSTNQAKADRYAQRAARERLRAREERKRAERLEHQIEETESSRAYALLRPVRRVAGIVRSRLRR